MKQKNKKINLPNNQIAFGETKSFHGNGNIYKISLSKEFKIKTSVGELNFDKEISFSENGNFCEGKSNTPFTIKFNENIIKTKYISFNENGSVYVIDLDDTQLVKTNIGKFKFFGNLSFYDNRNLMGGWFHKPTKIKTDVGKIKFEEGHISFYKNGKVSHGWLYDGNEIKTPIGKLEVGSDIHFYESGAIEQIFLYKKQNAKTFFGCVTLQDFKSINFYENGNLESCYLYIPKKFKTSIGNIEFEYMRFNEDSSLLIEGLLNPKKKIKTSVGEISGKYIHFHENGNLHCCKLSDAQGIKTPVGFFECYDDMYFHENGNLKDCYLYEQPKIKSSAGEVNLRYLSFYEDGTLDVVGLIDFDDEIGFSYIKEQLPYFGCFFNKDNPSIGKSSEGITIKKQDIELLGLK